MLMVEVVGVYVLAGWRRWDMSWQRRRRRRRGKLEAHKSVAVVVKSK